MNTILARPGDTAKRRANAANPPEPARESEGVVNVLGAGLVRRKPKAGGISLHAQRIIKGEPVAIASDFSFLLPTSMNN